MTRLWLLLLLLIGLVCGCSQSKPAPVPPISLDPTVKVVHPQRRNVAFPVPQPGVIDAYERTAIYGKVSGFVDKWYVDRGDLVKQGAPLVDLVAPELVAQHQQTQNQVVLDMALVQQSRKLVEVAESNVQASKANLSQTRSDVNRYQADVQRWESEVKRLTTLVTERVVNQQILDETMRQLRSSQATYEASQAAVLSRDAQRLSAEATQAKTEVDVKVAEAKVLVSKAEERRLAALVDYLKITAPYDCVVFARNVNLGDFVLPASGDPSQGNASIGVSPSRATPLYVLIRKDPMLFIVGVPEWYSRYVVSANARRWYGSVAKTEPTMARMRVSSLSDREFSAPVTRTSWAVTSTSRTLIVQVDVPNPNGEFRPGMYAYGTLFLKQSNVLTLPASTITQIGNQTYCYFLVDGKAVRTAIQVGLRDGSWIAVIGKQVPSSAEPDSTWQPFDGSEAVIDGDLSEINDGDAVKVNSGK
jgi:HlyD family secretion protein